MKETAILSTKNMSNNSIEEPKVTKLKNGRYKCNSCDKTYNGKGSANRHWKEIHSQAEKLVLFMITT